MNFPVLVTLSLSNFNYSKAKSDGTDLRFIDTDGTTQLIYHIEEWNTSGYSYVWVNVTNIDASSSSDYIWMYYGNPLASDVQDVSGTYDDNFTAVWHLNETPTVDNYAYDSTSNKNNGTFQATMTSGDQKAGKIDGGIDFDGTDDRINIPQNSSLDLSSSVTFSGWFSKASFIHSSAFNG